jgi:hypothetical protein
MDRRREQPGKGFAKPVTSPYPVFITAGEETQRRFVEWLLGQGERRRAVFVNWRFSRDDNDLWAASLRWRRVAPEVVLRC